MNGQNAVSRLVEQIFLQARIKNLPKARLADKAGLRPETLSRLSHRRFDLPLRHSPRSALRSEGDADNPLRIRRPRTSSS